MPRRCWNRKRFRRTIKVFCPGYAEFYGRIFHDAEKAAHGEVDLHKAIVHSCDVYFYNVGKQLGIDRISYYATKLGLGRKTGIDLAGRRTRTGAFGRVETARVPPEVVSGRNDFGGNRPGRDGRHSDADWPTPSAALPWAAYSTSLTC